MMIKLARSMFGLTSSPNLGDLPTIQETIVLLNGFVQKQSEVLSENFSKQTLERIVSAVERELHSQVCWEHEGYGCAVRWFQNADGQTHFVVIGLDKWSNIVTRTPSNDAFLTDAVSESFEEIHCGSVATTDCGEVLSSLNTELKRRLEQDKNAIQKGVQRTPGFLAAVLSDQIVKLNKAGVPGNFHGGFTDVGRHTDCPRRNLAWPLVRSALEHVVTTKHPESLPEVRQFLRLFQLHVIQSLAEACTVEPPALVNYVLRMLSRFTAATADSINLNECSVLEGKWITQACSDLRKKLLELLEERSDELRMDTSIQSMSGKEAFGYFRSFQLSYEPPDTARTSTASSVATLVSAEYQNALSLSKLELFRKETQPSGIVKLASEISISSAADRYILLCELESFFERLAEEILPRRIVFSTLFESSLQGLESLVLVYRSHVELYLEESKYVGNFKIPSEEWRSRELLIVWLLYCIAHRLCSRWDLLFRSYGASLNGADLAHLQIASRPLRTVIQCVHAYLSTVQNPNRRLFAGNDAVTLDFAAKFAKQDLLLIKRWEEYELDMDQAVDKHWQELESKKREIAEAGKRLKDLRETKDAVRADIDDPVKVQEYDTYKADFTAIVKSRDAIQVEIAKKDMQSAQAARARSLRKKLLGRTPMEEAADAEEDLRLEAVDAEEDLMLRSSLAEKNEELARITPKWKQLEAERIQKLKSIADLEKKITQQKDHQNRINENPPNAVSLPLPRLKDPALSVLFLLYTPIRYQLIIHASYLAQQLLIDKSTLATHKSALKEPHPSTLWTQIVTKTSVTCLGFQPNSGGLYLMASEKMLSASEIARDRPRTILQHHNKEDGVWYPDNFSKLLVWNGGSRETDQLFSTVPFNPFKVPCESPATKFTTKLTESADKLQWAMLLNARKDVPNERGNIALARQSDRPDWMSFQHWTAFASLRSQPLLQYSVLCSSLHDRTLPFARPCVHSLVKQMLAHVGPLHASSSPGSGSRFDWDVPRYKDEFQTIHYELVQVLDDMKESPSNLAQIQLAGQIASYFSQFDHKHVEMVRKYAAVAEKFGRDMESTSNAGSTGSAALDCEVVARQADCYGTGLLFFRYFPKASVSKKDVEDMCRLFVLFSNCAALSATKANKGPVLNELEAACCEVMGTHREAIQQTLNSEEDAVSILHACLSEVVSELPNRKRIKWRPWGNDAAGVFEGEVERDDDPVKRSEIRFLHVDVLRTGKILVNGFPLNGLPSAVREHVHYKSVFLRRNFKVVQMDSGRACKTAHPVDGFFYEFELVHERLLIRERGERDCKTLLDATAMSALDELPKRLPTLHLAWHCKHADLPDDGDEAIVFRKGKLVNSASRAIKFIYTRGHLYEVPASRSSEPWNELAVDAAKSSFRELMAGSNPVMDALSSFEGKSFVHVLHCPAVVREGDTANENRGRLFYSLPRYNLEFSGSAMDTSESSCLPCCETFKDGNWSLHRTQRPSGNSLVGLSNCLVLENDAGGIRLVVPDGKVENDTEAMTITISVDKADDPRAGNLPYFYYDQHVKGRYLGAFSTSARLHLATLYSACPSLVPDPPKWGGRLGFEVAVELIRQCFPPVDWRMSKRDVERLANCARLGRMHFPAIQLICVYSWELFRRMQKMQFLHGDIGELDKVAFSELEKDQDAMSCYIFESRVTFGGMPFRKALLLPHEEHFLFGSANLRGSSRAIPSPARPIEQLTLPLSSDPLQERASRFVEDTERTLLEFVMKDNEEFVAASFPIADSSGNAGPSLMSPLAREILEELQDSWDKDAKIVSKQVDEKRLREIMPGLCLQVKSQTEDLTKCLNNLVCHQMMPSTVQHVLIHKLRLAGGDIQPEVNSLRDHLLLGLCARDFVRHRFNPFLSNEFCDEQVQPLARALLKMDVLQDKLDRITLSLNKDGAKSLLVQELESTRCWSEDEFPSWLVFEAEQGLQIRPDQAAIAKHILKTQGENLQLQVGLGKTRVILPLIVLAFPAESVVRLNFLPSLHFEATAYLMNTLASSVLSRPAFTIPFTRDVSVSEGTAGGLSALWDLVKVCRGTVSTTPQRTMSMSLKLQEMMVLETDSTKLQHQKRFGQFFERFQTDSVDIFDESDEHLHTRFHIVYAIGQPVSLPSGPSRWVAVQQILLCVQRNRNNGSEIARLLSDPTIVAVEGSPETQSPPQTTPYCNVLFLPPKSGGEAEPNNSQDHVVTKRFRLTRALAEEACKNGLGLEWTKNLSEPWREAVLNVMTSLDVDAKVELDRVRLPEEFRAHVLAYRGLLACGLLMFCLSRRACVDFGVRRGRKEDKRLAVPYRANNTPAPRAEFSQIECSLVWTHLTYYQIGLTRQELLQALQELLKLGDSARETEFRLWTEFSPSSTVEKVSQIDLGNESQIMHLVQILSRNMAVVNFWLYHIVLPSDTSQFPNEISRTAWDVAGRTGSCRGISGTNFNHRLLPTQVRQNQRLEDAPTISATNGKMLRLILENSSEVGDAFAAIEVSTTAGTSDKSKWQELARSCLRQSFDALIDAGALVSGVENSQFAEFCLDQLLVFENQKDESSAVKRRRYRGVVYFSDLSNDWIVLDRNKSRARLSESSVKPREAFTYFDDYRCRGADLKLARDAKALLTVSTSTDLSKLIQSYGRLRQLGHDQNVFPVAHKSVLDAMGGVSVKHLLQFAFQNTVEQNVSSLMPWVLRGLDYFQGKTCRETNVNLDMYSTSCILTGFEMEIAAKVSSIKKRQPLLMDSVGIDDLGKRAMELGEGLRIRKGKIEAADEECERETEQEKEEEQEKEREVPKAEPKDEVDWGVTDLLQCDSAFEMRTSPFIGRLRDQLATSKILADAICEIPWSPDVYCTDNFLLAIDYKTSFWMPQDLYVRLAENIVLFKDGTMVLVSEREANALLAEILLGEHSPRGSRAGSLRNDSCRVAIVRSCYCRELAMPPEFVPLPVGETGLSSAPFQVAFQMPLAHIQLFNGDVKYTKQRLGILEGAILESPVGAIEDGIIVSVRRKSIEYVGSDLFNKIKFVRQQRELSGSLIQSE